MKYIFVYVVVIATPNLLALHNTADKNLGADQGLWSVLSVSDRRSAAGGRGGMCARSLPVANWVESTSLHLEE